MELSALYQQAAALLPAAVADYQTLHGFAEVGFDLPRTVQYVTKRLKEMGYTPQNCGKSGVVALLGDAAAQECILLRCDMDALPIREETDLPYAAQNGNMHACGHDMHTAMLLGAADLLRTYEDTLPCAVKFCFQPAEELLCGAADLLEHGVMENPVPRYALGLHVMTATPIPTGTVILPPAGISAPAAAMLRVHLQGKGCHGASPHLGVDPLPAAAQCLLGFQNILTREIPPDTDAAFTVGRISGGTAANAIADSAVLEGSFRAYDDKVMERIRQRICRIAGGIGDAYGVTATVSFFGECPTLRNDAQYGARLLHCLQAALPHGTVMDAAAFQGKEQQRQKGSEDFAFFSHRVPSVMLALAAGCQKDGFIHPLHHPKMGLDANGMVSGICAYAAAAVAYPVQQDATSPKP